MAKKIDIKTVDEIAHLARLEFSDEAKQGIITDMNRMLDFVDKLNEVNTDTIEPLIYMTQEQNVLREDVPQITLTQKEALKNAPQKDTDYFKAPKVIDNN
ncbi:MAG: Asp-tRNA(Asn)/Glu-tRNA(Gln) amidotransferase subunit GatC [Bacteroidia bacterium]|nr:Asp-tRNA(Asn)/Glu-tRNA(Gln) amidotransferase subunit GatC [Bacteroidia bacterium]